MKKFIPFILLCTLLSGCTSNFQNKIEENSKSHIKFEVNGQENEFDVVSGATTGKNNGKVYIGEEKEARMKWSGRPDVGIIQGDFYYDSLYFNGGYLATLSIVKDPSADRIIHVHLDERAPWDYFAVAWQNQTKRTSGYANWQMQNERTNVSLVTIVNTMTYLEHQVIEQNSVSGNFKTPEGSSTSGSKGFIPLLRQIEPKLNQESSQTMISVTQDVDAGLYASMQVVYDKNSDNIVDLHYDEYFADEKELIDDPNLKIYYRQSKYQSPIYIDHVDKSFKANVDSYRSNSKGNTELAESEDFGEWFNPLIKEINELHKN
ncbi:MAG: hypothetical protein RR565_07540 [Erysipelothrix sp.]